MIFKPGVMSNHLQCQLRRLVPGVTVMMFAERTATEGGLGPGGTEAEEGSPWLLVLSLSLRLS